MDPGDAVGSRLGDYTLLEQIGVGGMGHVYRARDERLGREVALKILPPGALADPVRLARFQREAKVASRLSNPHIATIYEAGEVEGQHFISMELVRGTTLDKQMQPGGLSQETVLDIGIALADGLGDAHTSGVIHRDLKPGNVMVDQRGRVKIVDFGLSRVSGGDGQQALDRGLKKGLTVSGQVMGTPGYMSPEQALGDDVDGRSDIFALGVILYELATGVRPFSGDSYATMMRSILEEEPPPCRSMNPRFDPELERCLRKALEKDPKVRYQTAADLGADLQRLKRDSTPQQPLRSGASRPRMPKAVPAVLGVVVVAVLLWSFDVFVGQGRETIRLAVVPFKATTTETLLVGGLADGLRGRLSRIRPQQLRVMGEFSSKRLSGAGAREVCSVLGVDYVLGGSVHVVQGSASAQANEERLRLSVWLDDSEGMRYWSSKEYEEPRANLSDRQDAIAMEIVQRLGVKLPAEPRKSYNPKPDAYVLYLQGRKEMYQHVTEDSPAAKKFLAATKLDPNYALAWAAAAREMLFQASWNTSPYERLGKPAMEYATRARKLDSNLAEARSAYALALFLLKWDLDEAEKEFKAAIELDPSNVDLYHWYGHLKGARGDQAEAVRLFDKTVRLDPLAHFHHTCMALHQILDGKLEQSEGHIDEALKLRPDWPLAYQNRGLALEKSGQFKLAVEQWREMAKVLPNPWCKSLLGYGMGRAGDAAGARKILQEFEGMIARGEFVSHLARSRVYAGLGEIDTAVDHIWKARENREPWLICARISVGHERLRNHPRYVQLLKELGLVE